MPERRVHDYRVPYWGHNCMITPDPDPVTARIIGYGHGVQQGDLLILANSTGACFYEIETIERVGDPPDMWFTHSRFLPASSELGLRAIAALDTPAQWSSLGLTSWKVIHD